MLESSLSIKGQVTIPKHVRNSLKLKPGDKVTFVTDGDKAILLPIRGDLLSLRGLLKSYTSKKSAPMPNGRALAKLHVVTRHHGHRQGPPA